MLTIWILTISLCFMVNTLETISIKSVVWMNVFLRVLNRNIHFCETMFNLFHSNKLTYSIHWKPIGSNNMFHANDLLIRFWSKITQFYPIFRNFLRDNPIKWRTDWHGLYLFQLLFRHFRIVFFFSIFFYLCNMSSTDIIKKRKKQFR